MRDNFKTVKELSVPVKLGFIVLGDALFIIVMYLFITTFLGGFVHPYFSVIFKIITVLWGVFMILPSGYNKGKKMWNTILLVIIRDRQVYHPITIEEEETHEHNSKINTNRSVHRRR